MKISYRPEIDGLRAIAVLSVIIYHAQINLFDNIFLQGGYLGVDIFFVISGYLITKIILTELHVTNNFSFLHFYERRFRRIIPPLTTVLVVTFIVSWFLLIPSHLVELSKSTIFSIFFTSNFFFYFTEIDYWAQNNLLSQPLLHTWSLAVEEQYYIFFPLTLFVIYRYLKKYLLFFLLIIFFLSLSSTVYYLSEIKNSLNFYMLHTRGWELIAGSFLSYIEIYKNKNLYNKKISNLLTLFGLILIFISFFYFEEKTLHPSFLTVIPIFGTSLVIFFSGDKFFVNRILSNNLLVKIGLISYALYLWHYPIFTLLKLSDNFDFFSQKIIAVVITFIFSITSYFLIEKPSRNKKNSFKLIFLIFSGICILTIFVANISINKNGFYERKKFTSNLEIKINDYVLDQAYYVKNHHLKFQKDYIPDNFELAQKNDNKILIVGNSRSVNLFQAVDANQNLFQGNSFNLLLSKKRLGEDRIECLHALLIKNYSICDDSFNYDKDILKQLNRADTFLLASKWEQHTIDYLEEIILILKNQQKKIILMDMPLILETYGATSMNIFDKFVYENGRLPNNNEVELMEKKVFLNLRVNKKFAFIDENNKRLKKISDKLEVPLLRSQDYQCDENLKKCHLRTPTGYKVYFDNVHSTNEGGEFLGKLFYEKNWDKIN